MEAEKSVFSHRQTLRVPCIKSSLSNSKLRLNKRLKRDGLKLLAQLPEACIPVAFLDPQYRGVLDKLSYGNEGQSRGRARSALQQMPAEVIKQFIKKIDYVLVPSGHLFLWVDKFHLCTGVSAWLEDTSLEVVDLLVWNKQRMGMGYRTRRYGEYVMILQKHPRRAKGVWGVHNIPDVWDERVAHREHAHQKPVNLQAALIQAVSQPGQVVLDPAAGSFSILEACKQTKRNFLGCDLNG